MASKKKVILMSTFIFALFVQLVSDMVAAQSRELCPRDNPLCHNGGTWSGDSTKDVRTYFAGCWSVVAVMAMMAL